MLALKPLKPSKVGVLYMKLYFDTFYSDLEFIKEVAKKPESEIFSKFWDIKISGGDVMAIEKLMIFIWTSAVILGVLGCFLVDVTPTGRVFIAGQIILGVVGLIREIVLIAK